jgi:hypothetical protein
MESEIVCFVLCMTIVTVSMYPTDVNLLMVSEILYNAAILLIGITALHSAVLPWYSAVLAAFMDHTHYRRSTFITRRSTFITRRSNSPPPYRPARCSKKQSSALLPWCSAVLAAFMDHTYYRWSTFITSPSNPSHPSYHPAQWPKKQTVRHKLYGYWHVRVLMRCKENFDNNAVKESSSRASKQTRTKTNTTRSEYKPSIPSQKADSPVYASSTPIKKAERMQIFVKTITGK